LIEIRWSCNGRRRGVCPLSHRAARRTSAIGPGPGRAFFFLGSDAHTNPKNTTHPPLRACRVVEAISQLGPRRAYSSSRAGLIHACGRVRLLAPYRREPV
jgi:hypothetical protein